MDPKELKKLDPKKDFVGVAEIAELLYVSRSRASRLTGHWGFPKPIAVVRSGSVWLKDDVLAYQERRLTRRRWPLLRKK